MSAAPVSSGNAVLIRWPEQAVFGRTIPKSKIYEHSGASSRLKNLFVTQVEQIVWQYKLAPGTINLPARPGVQEVQVLGIQLKSGSLDDAVLRAIDEAISTLLVFEVTRGEGEQAQTQMVAACKRPNEADASRWVISGYYATDWVPASAERGPMPVALDMAQLYVGLLQRVMPLPIRAGEALADWVARIERAGVLQREIERLRGRMGRERQFNRRVEMNSQLRILKAEHAALVRKGTGA